jgi:hypothetical protein
MHKRTSRGALQHARERRDDPDVLNPPFFEIEGTRFSAILMGTLQPGSDGKAIGLISA